MKINIRILILALSALTLQLNGSITFGSQYSSIELLNGANLYVGSVMPVSYGRIHRTPGALFTSDHPVSMTNSIYADGFQEAVMTGNVGPTLDTTPISISGSGQELRLQPEILLLDVVVSGSGARLAGQPFLIHDDQIVLSDSSTYVNVGLQNALNKNMNLNGGTINLLNDLKLADNVVLDGGGTINGNNNKVIIGGGASALSWPESEYIWANNSLIELNGDVKLTGTWILNNGTRLIGNGNMLNLNTGMLMIPAGATVSMSDVLLEDFATTIPKITWCLNGQLRISGVNLGLKPGVNPLTIDLTQGGIYVEGESTVLGRGRRIDFTLAASLTVDGVALNGDPLAAVNPFPIIPSELDPVGNPGYQGQRSHVNTFNSGVIRQILSGFAGSTVINNSTTNIGSIEISVSNLLTFTTSVVYNGGFTTLSFATASVPLVEVGSNVSATVTNVTLRDFEFNYLQVAAGSQFIFGNNTYIVLAQSSVLGYPCESLSTTYTFQGNVVVDGGNNCIDLGDDSLPGPKGGFFIESNSQLSIQNLTIKNLGANKIQCVSPNSTLGLRNVTLILDSDFSFTQGSLLFQDGLTDIQGNYTFAYNTGLPSFIFSNATLQFSNGSTFSYNPPNDNRDLLVFSDNTAVLSLVNGTLASTNTGIRLTIGSLHVDASSFLTQNTGASLSMSEGIAFGNGNPDNEITVTIGPGAVLELLSGRLVYDQVS